MDVHDTPQIWRNYLQGGDREQDRFLKYIQTKQTTKVCSFVLFSDFSAEIRIKQKLHCHEIKSFAKKQFIKKNLLSWHSLLTSLSTNYFPQQ